jgi:LPS sulfotransferase NodH
VDRPSYLVCATPRSGSTLLCEGLKATGVAGRPEEYFEAVPATGRPRVPEDYLVGLEDPAPHGLLGGAPPPEPPSYSSRIGVGLDEHVARVREWGTTPNGVFGAKLMWGHLQDLPGTPAELLGTRRYVWVRREDKVRQAISLWRAMQTQSWRDESGAASGGGVEYSFPAIRHLAALLEEHDRAWERWLDGLPALALTYDEIAADLPRVLERTLEHLGVERPDPWPPALPAMRRQADELSDAWCAAYTRDLSLTPT